MSGHAFRLIACALVMLLAACGPDNNAAENTKGAANEDPRLSGGATTVFDRSSNAFSLPAPNIPITHRDRFFVGNAFFKQPWVIAPASTTARDGLGPMYNTNTCQGCHIKDGRGHAPDGPQADALSLLIRLSVTPSEGDDTALGKFGAIAHPVYGGQLQDRGIPGVPPEGRIEVHYSTHSVELADGAVVELRRPEYKIEDWAYGDPGPGLMISPRVAPPMIGLGLLENIPETALRAAADPDDADGDGISGRINTVWNFDTEHTAIGRFGWKAGQPSVRQQTAAAFAGDMGLTSSRFAADDCSPKQKSCLAAPHGGTPEVSDAILDEVVFYAQHIGVPARRTGNKDEVGKGEKLFKSAGCSGCHTPMQKTADNPDAPYLSEQTIYPYTDLLLHDMGEALADHRPEFSASGREWRTAPLWGIGLTKTVSSQATFLHDGRARNLLEAILWHGGEAAKSRDAVTAMSKTERDALMAFLESL